MLPEYHRQSASLRARLILPATLVLLVTVIGTLGYAWLGREQGATLLDALFMTVITITTIGYGEVIRLDAAGRIFTMGIAITGIGSLFYSLTVIMDNLVGSRLLDPFGEKKMQREVRKLKDHIIIAGLGRVGKQAAAELEESKVPFIIVDPRPEVHGYAVQRDYLSMQGDASDDAVLEQAGIYRAKGLIVTSGDDASNLYIVLSARVLRPDLFIVSRAVDESSVSKLIRAGANRAISPYAIGGRRLAHLILSPTVIDFFDTVIRKGEESINLEGIEVRGDARAVGQSLAGLKLREKTGASVLVVMRGNRVLPNPEPELVLHPGDRLLALGTVEQLDRLEALVGE
ncbi:voltage-gated potassium channel [Methylomagnum ishizawai]|uniref:Voltage-gated potassium channel n=1 Tax=Methylomagnum ishizawai TaxID=1760988 RepID=A0A1Y6D0E3_9GAMM|nr:potassium channel protein [Methylomagnum ishizawai]SMF93874.1 voltage-gated potassium channel [Methylomagnum ishizawai]